MRTTALLLFTAATAVATAEPPALPRSTPEAQGVPSSAILAFVEAAEKNVDALHSLMVLRHGQVVAEGWWEPVPARRPARPLLPQQELRLDRHRPRDRRGEAEPRRHRAVLLPRGRPEGAEREPEGDAGAGPAGHVHGPPRRRDRAASPYVEPDAVPDPRLPGPAGGPQARAPTSSTTRPASYMLSAIVQKVSGTPLVDYLRPRLFEPLGIRNPKWDATPQGVTLGGFGLSVTTEDIAPLRPALPAEGRVGREAHPARRVGGRPPPRGRSRTAATRRATGTRATATSSGAAAHGVYRGRRRLRAVLRRDAASSDAVVAITSGDERPAGRPEPRVGAPPARDEGGGTLPADAPAHDRLRRSSPACRCAPPAGKATSPNARRVSGRVYELPKNDDGIEAVAVQLGKEPTLVVTAEGREYRVPLGLGDVADGAGSCRWAASRSMADGAYRRRRERGLDRRRHLHGEGLLPRDAVLRHARPALRRRRARPRPGDERRLRPDEAADAGRPSAPGRAPQPARRAETSQFKT